MSESPNPFNGPAGLLDFSTVPTKGVVTSVNGADGPIVLLPGTNMTSIVQGPPKTFTFNAAGGGGGGVTSLDALTGAVVLSPGAGISVTDNVPAPNSIEIANTGVLSIVGGTAMINVWPPGPGTGNLTLTYLAACTRYNRNATQTIPDSTPTNIIWTNAVIDTNFGADAFPSPVMTIPRNGIWNISGQVTMVITPGSSTANLTTLSLIKNSGGTTIQAIQSVAMIPDTNDVYTFSVNTDIQCVAGDTIWLEFLSVAAVATPRDISGAAGATFLACHQVY